MKKYPLIYNLSESEINTINKFADECVKTNYHEYKRRNQFDYFKIKNDIIQGKTTEQLIYNLFYNLGKKINYVDYSIYTKEKKSYNPDLFILDQDNNIIKLHIKSCYEKENLPISWVFQKNDPLISSTNSNEFIVLVVFPLIKFTDIWNRESSYHSKNGYFYLINAMNNKNLFENPIKKDLYNKLCIYENKLKD
jgi:hypothetical protein